jgi:polysaccharide biosynthesis protein PslH
MSSPTILYVARRPPYPLSSGTAIRQFHLLREYAKWGKVRLVCFASPDEQAAALPGLSEHCDHIDFISPATTYRSRMPARVPPVIASLLAMATPYPRTIAWEFSSALARAVERSSNSADIVHVAKLHMAPYGLALRRRRPQRQPVVLDLDDVEATARARQLRLTTFKTWASRVFWYQDLLRFQLYQRAAIRAFDRVFVCSEHDRRNLMASNVVVVPNGVTVPDSPLPLQSDGRTMIFCGLLAYEPNVDAAEFFCRSVLPRIQQRVRHARLLIIGRSPSHRVRALHDGTGVFVHGDVPDVREYYGRAAIAVVPLRSGGGTRLKILEAWSLGVPVVSTSIGCEGLEGVPGRHHVVADDPDDFATACVALLQDPQRRDELAQSARELVGRYRWDTITPAVVEIASALLSTGRYPVTKRPVYRSATSDS